MKHDVVLSEISERRSLGDYGSLLPWRDDEITSPKRDVSLVSHNNDIPFAEIERQLLDSVEGHKKKKNREVSAYFKSCTKLGTYAVVKFNDELKKCEIKIVVEQDMPWVQKLLNTYFKRNVHHLSLEETLTFLQNRASVRDSKNSESANEEIMFFDDHNLRVDKRYSLSILGQLILEKYTDFQSRIAAVEVGNQVEMVIFLKEISNYESYLIINPSSSKSGLHLKRVNELVDDHLKIIANGITITHPQTIWSDKSKIITVVAHTGEELKFQVSGRTPTEKRFKKEEEFILAASDTDLVPVEIYFLPYYRPLGHTAIRVGESLYELSMKGWKIHGDGSDSARAFLFNNPFFRTQYNLLSKFGMQPVSFGKTIRLEKVKAMQIRETLNEFVKEVKSKENKFNILTNNCNQGVVRLLHSLGVEGFVPNGYIAFSSVLSFRRYLLESPHSTEAIHIYPLPGTQFNEINLRKYIPGLIYKENDRFKEFKRTFPAYIHNILYLNYHAVKKKVKNIFSPEAKGEKEV